MKIIVAVLFCLSSLLIYYNSSTLLAMVSNSVISVKPRFTPITALYLLCAGAYAFMYASGESGFAAAMSVILILYYLLLYLCVYFNDRSCRTAKRLYVLVFYLSVDSLLCSVLKFIARSFMGELDAVSAYIMTLVSGIILFAVLTAVSRRSQSVQWQTSAVSVKIYLLILVALFCSGGLIESQISITNEVIQNYFIKLLTLFSIILLFFIIIALVYSCISKSYFENLTALLEKQITAQIGYYSRIDKLNTEMREFRHDYKNHMICLQALVEKGQLDDAAQYLKGITMQNIIDLNKFQSGNRIADAILSDKAELAKQHGISLTFHGVIYENIPAADICTILSNALDNAVEACGKIDDGEKIIAADCVYAHNVQIIRVTNTVAENVNIVNGTVETSKPDKSSHGIGLYNIRKVVGKYSGDFEISCADGQFTLDICFKII